MRYAFVVGLLVAFVAVPAAVFAQAGSSLSVSGTVTSTGTLSGTTTTTIGGVTGTLTSSSGSWTMTVDGVTFATGTYSCSGGGCNYTGAVLTSKTTTFSFTTNSITGAISNATGFTTHGAWVSTVAHWAGAHQSQLAAKGFKPGDVVSSAAKDHPSHDPSDPSHAQADHVSGGGGHGGDHGGGGDHGHGK